MSTLMLELSDVDVARIADAVVARIAPKKGHATVEEAAGELRISVRSVHRHIAADRLRSRKIGSRTLVLRESIDRLLEVSK